MNEGELILQKFRAAQAEGISVALATVVKLHGSSYRRPGAKMLITRDGQIAGSVSGGCLERDLIRRAVRMMDTSTDEGAIVIYDTRADADDDEAEARVRTVGLGCEGVIEIFLNPKPGAQLEAIAQVFRSRRPQGFALALPDGTAFVDQLSAPVRLILFGAGHDTVPMSRLAHELGWSVTVVDCHSSFAVLRSSYIGVADYRVASPALAAAAASVDQDSLAMVMTHNYEHDLEILKHLTSGSRPRYAAVLGPKKRTEKLFAELRAQGVQSPEAGMHYPMGLDIGGDSPQTIALSALAQAQAVLAGRHGGFLSLADRIHDDPDLDANASDSRS